MKLQKILLASTATVLALSAGFAVAQFQKPEDAIKYRQSAFTVMANSFGKISAVVKGEVPYNKDDVAKNAASEKMQLAVVDLNKAAQSGDLESIKKAFGTAGASCKNCHDDFKKK